jgi:ribosome-interacting GTPase 1
LPELKGGIHDLFDVLSEIYGARFSMLRVSAESGEGLEQLRQAVFELLDVIRVYTKAPGKKLERTAPYLLKRAARLMDLAAHVHQDFLAQLKYARLWGHGRVEGQMVNRDHVLEDRDLVELHR